MQFIHAALHFDQSLDLFASHYGSWVYAVLFAIVFCETALLVLFFLPGDPLLFIAGTLCATGVMDIWILMGLLFIAASIGSIVNYWIGDAIGNKASKQNYKWLNRAALQRTHAFYEKHGRMTLLLSPFVAVVRTFAPFVAGVSAMTFKKFLLFTAAGDAIWVLTLVPAGYFFGNITVIRNHLSAIVLLGIGVGVGSLFLGRLWKRFRRQLIG